MNLKITNKQTKNLLKQGTLLFEKSTLKTHREARV